MMSQTLLALYSYNTRSGVMVDVGERTEVLPITDGKKYLCSKQVAGVVIIRKNSYYQE